MRRFLVTLENPSCEALWQKLLEGEMVAMPEGIVYWGSSSTIRREKDVENRDVRHQD